MPRRNPRADLLEQAIAYIADRGINVDALFTHKWRLGQAEEAYRVFDRQDAGKGVILPN